MHYLFSGFLLDTEKKELFYNNNTVKLTGQSYLLLEYWVQHPGEITSKETLIEKVWKGRIVASNTIDQSLYKLKKTLNSIHSQNYFESIYGLGIKFMPVVKCLSNEIQNTKHKQSSLHKVIISVSAVSLLVFVYFLSTYFKSKTTVVEKTNRQELFLVTPENQGSSNWLKNGPTLLITQILSHSKKVTLKDKHDIPQYLTQKNYLETQWKFSPQLKLLTTELSIQGNLFTLNFSLVDKQGNKQSQDFTNNRLNATIEQGINWLNLQDYTSSSVELKIPEDSYLLETYMRGLAAVANEQIDNAIDYFQLCINQDSQFHMAKLQLAQLYDRQGKQIDALALLDTIDLSNNNPLIEIESKTIRGGILLRQGEPDKALSIYLQLLQAYSKEEYPQLLLTEYKLSILYRSLSQNQKSMEHLNSLESSFIRKNDYAFLAEVYQAKSSLFLLIGESKKSKHFANLAMQQFSIIGDLIGQAKTHSVLARIAAQQAEYEQALKHLKQSLNITKSLKYKFGIGATLNEIISILILQGKLNQALGLIQEMESIANEINFTAMQLAAKQFTIEISLILKRWKKANIILKEHLELAQASNNKRALLSHAFLSIDLAINENKQELARQQLQALKSSKEVKTEKRAMIHWNIAKAKHYLLVHQQQQAEHLLLTSSNSAKEIEDGESIIKINNILSELYLKQDKAQNALAQLEYSSNFKVPPYPYLRLKAQALFQLGKKGAALETASLCKRQAYELWTLEDEVFLNSLIPKSR